MATKGSVFTLFGEGVFAVLFLQKSQKRYKMVFVPCAPCIFGYRVCVRPDL